MCRLVRFLPGQAGVPANPAYDLILNFPDMC